VVHRRQRRELHFADDPCGAVVGQRLFDAAQSTHAVRRTVVDLHDFHVGRADALEQVDQLGDRFGIGAENFLREIDDTQFEIGDAGLPLLTHFSLQRVSVVHRQCLDGVVETPDRELRVVNLAACGGVAERRAIFANDRFLVPPPKSRRCAIHLLTLQTNAPSYLIALQPAKGGGPQAAPPSGLPYRRSATTRITRMRLLGSSYQDQGVWSLIRELASRATRTGLHLHPQCRGYYPSDFVDGRALSEF
jgi:hypothetical protein